MSENSKSEYRNPKQTEQSNKHQIRKSKTPDPIPRVWNIVCLLFFINLNLFRISDFELRIFFRWCPMRLCARYSPISLGHRAKAAPERSRRNATMVKKQPHGLGLTFERSQYLFRKRRIEVFLDANFTAHGSGPSDRALRHVGN